MPKTKGKTFRYGIAEWYGRNFSMLNAEDIRKFAKAANSRSIKSFCPFRGDFCNKKGGVCSLRLYEMDNMGTVKPADSSIATMCPERFLQDGTVFHEVAEKVLQSKHIQIIKELPFLVSSESDNAVGKIDMVLVAADKRPLSWCALEIQAVYFSGDSMGKEFTALLKWDHEGIPFPVGRRRPDFRSSGPKRLMPQLQIKVPTISRWGKKTVVVIDKSFWDSLGSMNEIEYLSNCDIVWFVSGYEEDTETGQFVLRPEKLHLTTLGQAVEGLTAGIPTSLEAFEEDIQRRLQITKESRQTSQIPVK